MNYLIVVLLITTIGFLAYSAFVKNQAPCFSFAPTDSSHIRMNTCTGEAHVIVRGANGFEWQHVND